MATDEVITALAEPSLDLGGQPGTIVLEHRVDGSPDKVWQSLTDPAHLNNWFGISNSVAPGVGGTTKHSWGDPVTAEGKILIWEPNQRLKTSETVPFGSTFQPSDGGNKQRTIDYTLTPSGDQTVVKQVWSGFGTNPEWNKFQAATVGCSAFQAAALGQYVKYHYGEQRTVSWARVPSEKSYGEMWALLTGPKGILSEGSISGLGKGDKYHIRTTAGDTFEGVVISNIPNKQFAGTVDNHNNSLLRIVLDRPGPNEAGVWLASWGAQPSANQTFEWRWTNTLQRLLH